MFRSCGFLVLSGCFRCLVWGLVVVGASCFGWLLLCESDVSYRSASLSSTSLSPAWFPSVLCRFRELPRF